jgi:hypothetical protein
MIISARAGLTLSVMLALAGCSLSSSGGGNPKAVFQLVITAGSASGTYVWSPTAVPGGAYSRDTSGGGSAAYVFNSYNDSTVVDTTSHGGSELRA